jgi:hypothetical protein
MEFGWTSGAGVLTQQARSVRRLNFIFGSLLLIATLLLAGTTSSGARLLRPDKTDRATQRQVASPFESFPEVEPLPLLINLSNPEVSPVEVKGESISRGTASAQRRSSGISTLEKGNPSDFIKSFEYQVVADTRENTISLMWHTSSTKEAYLYIVNTAEGDTVFSIEGKDLDQHFVSLDNEQYSFPLSFSVYHKDGNGRYELVESKMATS